MALHHSRPQLLSLDAQGLAVLQPFLTCNWLTVWHQNTCGMFLPPTSWYRLARVVLHVVPLLLLFIFLIHHFITFTIQIMLFLTLWVGRQEEHPACKKWVMRCWRGYLCEVRCKWFACGPADATATPSSLASLTSTLFDLSGADLSRLSWKRGC